MKELDQLVDLEASVVGIADYDERYDKIVNNLEALVVGYSIDVTSDTLSDIAAVSEKLESYELQDDDTLT